MRRLLTTGKYALLAAASLALATLTAASAHAGNAPAVSDLKVQVEYNVEQEKEDGLLFHLKFQVNNARGLPCRPIVYFWDQKDRPLPALEEKYSASGDASVEVECTPPYDHTIFTQDLFIPYRAILTQPGFYYVRFVVNVWCPSLNRFLVSSPQRGRFTLQNGPVDEKQKEQVIALENQIQQHKLVEQFHLQMQINQAVHEARMKVYDGICPKGHYEYNSRTRRHDRWVPDR